MVYLKRFSPKVKLCVVLALVILFINFAVAIETSSVFLKVSLNKGASLEKTILVSNTYAGDLNLEVLNMPGVASNLDILSLDIGEKKEVKLRFDSKELDPGVHAGRLKISDGMETSFLPIVFEVESENVLFDLNLEIPPQYIDIKAGDKIFAQAKIFDLVSGGTSEGLGTTEVETEYFIMDFEGRVLSSINENVIVNKEARVTKSIPIPENIDNGDYVFFSVVKYKSSVGISSQIFTVTKSSSGSLTGFFSGDSMLVLILVGVILFFFLIVVGLFIYMMHDRDSLILELKKYNSWETRKQKELIYKEVKGKMIKDRRKIKEKVRSKISVLKRRQKKRMEDFERFRKEGNVKSMENKIKEWKKHGYNTIGLENAVKVISTKDMKRQISKWKKQGYKKG